MKNAGEEYGEALLQRVDEQPEIPHEMSDRRRRECRKLAFASEDFGVPPAAPRQLVSNWGDGPISSSSAARARASNRVEKREGEVLSLKSLATAAAKHAPPQWEASARRGNRVLLWDAGGVAGDGDLPPAASLPEASSSDTCAAESPELILESVSFPSEYPPRQTAAHMTEDEMAQMQQEAQEREYQQHWVQEQMRAHMALFETQRQSSFGMAGEEAAKVPMAKRRLKSNQPMLPGDWECPRCGDHQFSRNWSCRNCGGMKND